MGNGYAFRKRGSPMQVRLLLPAMLMLQPAPMAAAQQYQTQTAASPPAQQDAPKPKPGPKAEARAREKARGSASGCTGSRLKARFLEKIGDWSVFIYEDAAGRVCFAAALPSDMQPKGRQAHARRLLRNDLAEGRRPQRGEREARLFDQGEVVSDVAIGNQHFTLPAGGDLAYTKDTGDERKLLAAMASGSQMAVKATLAKGTATTDQYSLQGASSAVQKLQEACP